MNMLEYKYITITFLELYNHSTVFVFTSYNFMYHAGWKPFPRKLNFTYIFQIGAKKHDANL